MVSTGFPTGLFVALFGSLGLGFVVGAVIALVKSAIG